LPKFQRFQKLPKNFGNLGNQGNLGNIIGMQADKNTLEKTWVVFPLTQSWEKSACLIFFLSAFCLAVYFSFKSIFYSFFSAVVLFGSLSSFFLPVRYEFHTDHLKIRALFRTVSKDWKEFHSFYVDKNGVLLSPFDKPSRIENFRGIYVRFGQTDPEEIIKLIKQNLKEQRT